MLSLTIVKLQEIIPKLMALQKGWFKHARRDFKRFASLRTKKIGTWPFLTSPWVTGCPDTHIYLISFLTFYCLGNIPFHLLPLLLKLSQPHFEGSVRPPLTFPKMGFESPLGL